MTFSIKDIVSDNNKVRFVKYFDGALWYRVQWFDPSMEQGDPENAPFHKLEFPVPIADIGNATFLAEDRAILFMRYIRKYLDMINEATHSQEI